MKNKVKQVSVFNKSSSFDGSSAPSLWEIYRQRPNRTGIQARGGHSEQQCCVGPLKNEVRQNKKEVIISCGVHFPFFYALYFPFLSSFQLISYPYSIPLLISIQFQLSIIFYSLLPSLFHATLSSPFPKFHCYFIKHEHYFTKSSIFLLSVSQLHYICWKKICFAFEKVLRLTHQIYKVWSCPYSDDRVWGLSDRIRPSFHSNSN